MSPVSSTCLKRVIRDTHQSSPPTPALLILPSSSFDTQTVVPLPPGRGVVGGFVAGHGPAWSQLSYLQVDAKVYLGCEMVIRVDPHEKGGEEVGLDR